MSPSFDSFFLGMNSETVFSTSCTNNYPFILVSKIHLWRIFSQHTPRLTATVRTQPACVIWMPLIFVLFGSYAFPHVLHVSILPLHTFVPSRILTQLNLCAHHMRLVLGHPRACEMCMPFACFLTLSRAWPIACACCCTPTSMLVLRCFCAHPQVCPCCCHQLSKTPQAKPWHWPLWLMTITAGSMSMLFSLLSLKTMRLRLLKTWI